MAHEASGTFRDAAAAALQDTQLRGALRTVTSEFGARRRTVVATTPEWDT